MTGIGVRGGILLIFIIHTKIGITVVGGRLGLVIGDRSRLAIGDKVGLRKRGL